MMRSRRAFFGFVLFAFLATICTVYLTAGLPQYVENFTTTTYKDPDSTTALWDTASGTLGLPPFQVTTVGSAVPTTAAASTISDVVALGDLLYVANGDQGISVFDIGVDSPGFLTEVGSLRASYYPMRDIAIQGNYCYAAANQDGLWIIDISDPTSMSDVAHIAGGLSVPGYFVYGVAVDGNHAYIGAQEGGVRIIDVADPTSPWIVDTYAPSGIGAFAVEIADDHLYATDVYNDWLFVLNVADTTNPALVGSVPTRHSPRYMDLEGDIAYVADADSGVTAVDISDPSNPAVIGGLTVPGFTWRVAVSGNYLYSASRAGGLHVIDVSDPTNMQLVETVPNPQDVFGIDVAATMGYMGTADSVHVLEVATLLPTPLKSVQTGTSWGGHVCIEGDLAYVSGLGVLDISDPMNPSLIGTGLANGRIEVRGNRAFIAAGTLRIYDITDPTNPIETGSIAIPSGNTLDVEEDHVYVAGLYGVYVVDVSDSLTNPPIVGHYETDHLNWAIEVEGDLAFVDGPTDTMLVLDVSDPTNPTQAGFFTNTFASEIVFDGDLMYIAKSGVGLEVWDATVPTNPTLLGSISGFSAEELEIAGDYAFALRTGATDLLNVIDVSDPTNPTLVSSMTINDFPIGTHDIAIAGDHLYVTPEYSRGLGIVEVFQRRFDPSGNVAQSLEVDGADDVIRTVRMSTTHEDSVAWELTADGGASWQSAVPDNSWFDLSSPGNDLRWRSTHVYSGGGVNPTASSLQIEWQTPAPVITSIVDIGNDQGKQVRVTWMRSSNDHAGSATPVTSYSVFRSIDPNLTAAVDSRRKESLDLPRFVEGEDAPERLPGWDFVATVPAYTEHEYSVVAPTLKDSTVAEGQYYTTFLVRAGTAVPAVFFDSDPDSGYSLDNLAPFVPQGFAVAYNTGSGNQLTWEPAQEPDFQYYRVYRSTDPEFVPDPGNLVHSTTEPGWADPEHDGGGVYYKVTSTDFSGNESEPATAGTVTAVEKPAKPTQFAVYQNSPNPFNPTTAIRYDVPEGGGKVALQIYDVTGRLVRTLANSVESAGEKQATWDGRDDLGHRVTSGVYFYRMTAPGFTKTRKMVLLK